MATLTASQRRALAIIRDHGDAIGYPKQFAKLMWPDSEGWQTHARMGRGTHRGAGMYGAAGAYLGRLKKSGLIGSAYRGGVDRFARRWFLTKAGREALAEVEQS